MKRSKFEKAGSCGIGLPSLWTPHSTGGFISNQWATATSIIYTACGIKTHALKTTQKCTILHTAQDSSSYDYESKYKYFLYRKKLSVDWKQSEGKVQDRRGCNKFPVTFSVHQLPDESSRLHSGFHCGSTARSFRRYLPLYFIRRHEKMSSRALSGQNVFEAVKSEPHLWFRGVCEWKAF